MHQQPRKAPVEDVTSGSCSEAETLKHISVLQFHISIQNMTFAKSFKKQILLPYSDKPGQTNMHIHLQCTCNARKQASA